MSPFIHVDPSPDINPFAEALARTGVDVAAITLAAANGIAFLDPRGQLLAANAALLTLFGRAQPALIGHALVEFAHPDDADRLEELLRTEVVAAGRAIRTERRCLRGDGQVIWVRLTLSPVRRGDVPCALVLAMLEDVTEQRVAEAARLEEARHFRAVLENVQLLAVILDAGGQIIFCNDYFLQTTGWRREEVLGQDWFTTFLPAEQRDAMRAIYRDAVATAVMPSQLENVILTRTGARRLIAWNNAMHRDAAGRAISTTSIGEDITERRHAEEGMKLAASVIANTIEGVTITDARGKILSVNAAFTTITGYTADEAIGRNPRILKSDRHDQPFYAALWDALIHRGAWRGEIWNRRKDGEAYPEYLTISAIRNDAGETTHYVAVFNDISERKQSEAVIRHQAYHDALTNLPNRQLFVDRVEMALAHARHDGRTLAVCFLDLDRFKNINDTLGHITGDRLLQQVAKRLLTSVHPEDTVSRMGGDEFTLLLAEGVTEPRSLRHVAEQLMHAFREAFVIDGHELFITPSIGISVFPQDGDEVETLMKHADTALYRAKASGRNTYQLFSAEMNAEAAQRLEMENALWRALAREEFVLHYQPRVDIASGRTTSMEALIRWQRPAGGLVSPAQFIPLAEETGLIIPIGAWVLRAACAQNRAWQRAGMPPLRVAVNLSGRQFQQPDLVAQVQQVLAETGLAPQYLELEITESAVMEDVEKTLATMAGLRALGVHLAIDDFGTAYSSLNYLKRFPVHALKIDKSFIDGVPESPDDGAIANAIIALAHSLGLTVIAEGVEREAQLAFLRAHACEEVQGYYFCKPVPAEVFAQQCLGRSSESR